MKHARMLLTIAAGTTLLSASPAAAAKECSRKATVTAGAVHDLRKTSYDADGHGTLDPATPSRIAGKGGYIAQAGTELRFGKVTYELAKDTFFALGCFGHTQAEGAIFPALTLFAGKATATARKGEPGGITSNEGLFDPYLEQAMSFSVERTPKGDPTTQELIDGAAGIVTFGKAVVARTKGDGKLNITPYVGRKRGVCVQHERATLVSKKLNRQGYFVGTVNYGD